MAFDPDVYRDVFLGYVKDMADGIDCSKLESFRWKADAIIKRVVREYLDDLAKYFGRDRRDFDVGNITSRLNVTPMGIVIEWWVRVFRKGIDREVYVRVPWVRDDNGICRVQEEYVEFSVPWKGAEDLEERIEELL